MNTQIMIIDDELSLRKALAFTLKSAGYRDVVLIESFDRARPVLSKTRPSLIILDILMPGTDGFKALGEIHSLYPDVPVIMLTGVDEVDSAVMCMKIGARDYLTKPASENRILECVRSVMVINYLTKDEHASIKHAYIKSASELLEELREWAAGLRNRLTPRPVSKREPLHEKFMSLFIDNKAYCEPELTIHTLTIRLETNQKTLSNFVNSTFGMNFRMLINRLRVAEFIHRISAQDGMVYSYSTEMVAQETGFDRLATFYKAFKAVTNTTPAVWLRQQREESRPAGVPIKKSIPVI
jgi:YesN/AraC family two-component response regulator